MNVLVLGPCGTIGTSVTAALLLRGHAVTGLVRSGDSARQLESSGGRPIRGDIRRPAEWAAIVDEVDAIINVAGDFTDDAGSIDRQLVDALLQRSGRDQHRRTMIWTGGCWLYGATGDRSATEETPFDPLPAFAWCVENLRLLLADPRIRGIAIHPAMVYERDGGVFSPFQRDLLERREIRIVGNARVRWPLVHRDDIGLLYALALERALPGSSYNGAAIESFPVATIASAMAKRFGVSGAPLVRTAEDMAHEHGEWARGYALDQAMSGDKARRELGWHPTHRNPLADVE